MILFQNVLEIPEVRLPYENDGVLSISGRGLNYFSPLRLGTRSSSGETNSKTPNSLTLTIFL